MKVHYLYFFNVLSVFQYDKRPSLKSTPLSELMAGAALNATFINYTVSLQVNSIVSANGFRTDEIFWNIDADWFGQIPRRTPNCFATIYFSTLVLYDLSISHSAFQKKMSLLSSQHAAISVKERRVWARQMKKREREGEMSLINSSEAIFIF